jgi:hypothetical protein
MRKMISPASVAIDQIVSAASNFLLVVLLGRSAGIEEVGRLSAAWAVYLPILGFQRLLITDPLLALAPARDNRAHACARTTVVAYNTCASLGLLITAGITRSELLLTVSWVSLIANLLDLERYLAFRRKAPADALLVDLLWLVLLAGVEFLGLFRTASSGLDAWGLTAAGGLAVGAWRNRSWFANAAEAWVWWRRDASRSALVLALDGVLYTVATSGTILVLAESSGLRVLGNLRAAQSMVGPVLMVVTGFNFYFIPRLAAGTILGRRATRVGVLSSLLALLFVVVLSSVGPQTALTLFGHTATVSRAVVALMGLQCVATVATAPLVAAARVRQQLTPMLLARVAFLVVGVPLLLPGLHWSDRSAALVMAMQSGAYLAILAVLRSPRFRHSSGFPLRQEHEHVRTSLGAEPSIDGAKPSAGPSPVCRL